MRKNLWLKVSLAFVFVAYISAFNYGGCGGAGGGDETTDSGSSGQNLYRAPVFNAIGNKTIAEGATLTFTVSATDPDGDTITYMGINLPAGATFNTTTNVFTWVPNYNQAATYAGIRFRATDSTYLYTEETITITVTDVAAPNAPSNLISAVASTTQINLSWQDNSSDESGFKIEQKIGSGSYTQIASLAADVVSYNNTGLVDGTIYYYRVRSYTAAGNSAYTNEVSASTTGINAPPNIMNNYLSNVSHNTASFYGNLNPNGLATAVYFEYGATTAYGT
ncbi:MAG: putative Ig domain-containing protein, partial [Candidatus Brocadiia bacterium]